MEWDLSDFFERVGVLPEKGLKDGVCGTTPETANCFRLSFHHTPFEPNGYMYLDNDMIPVSGLALVADLASRSHSAALIDTNLAL